MLIPMLLQTILVGSGYTLNEVTNDDYIHVTLPQIVAKVGQQKQYLTSYVCDGTKENALFSGLAFSNAAGDSLKLKASAEGNEEIFTYKEGKFYRSNGASIRHMSDPFLIQVEDALVKIEKLPSGKSLLAELEHSPYPLTIVKGRNHFSATGPNGIGNTGIYQASTVMFFQTLLYPEKYNMLNQIGNGGNINFDPNGNYERIESDNSVRSVPAYIALAHESYHAYDSIRGLLDRRQVVGDEYETTEVCEYRAVYFENKMRKEAGIRYAKYYGTTDPEEAKGKPGLLSPSGEPYAIPAPCLNEADVDAILHGNT